MIDIENIPTREDFIKYFKPTGLGLEVGVYEGEFSRFLLDNCPDLNLILLDCWQEQEPDIYKDYMNSKNEIQIQRINRTISNTINHYNRINLIKGFSDDFSKLFADNIFDFIFIDANHSYESVKKDLINWYPKVKNGGLFCGHDYFDGSIGNGDVPFGVKAAVDEFGIQNKINIYSTNESFLPTWFFVKKD
jgi:predicted O-methyltransferase YrrM